MESNDNKVKEGKKKSFFARLFDKLDKKIKRKGVYAFCHFQSGRGGQGCLFI